MKRGVAKNEDNAYDIIKYKNEIETIFKHLEKRLFFKYMSEKQNNKKLEECKFTLFRLYRDKFLTLCLFIHLVEKDYYRFNEKFFTEEGKIDPTKSKGIQKLLSEQKMDEVVKRLEKLAEEQEAIVEELSKDEDMTTLASRKKARRKL